MRRLSLTQRIKRYFQKRPTEWINGGEIERLVSQATHLKKGKMVPYKASNGARRLRESESGRNSKGERCEKFLEKQERNGSVWYKYIGEEKKEPLIVDDENGRRVIIQEKLIEV